MSIFKNSKGLPAFDIFENLFHLALNCKWEDENIVKRKQGPIKKEDLSLLLAWPGILMIRLAQITGDTTYQNSLKNLSDMLENDTGNDQIRDYLDKIIEPQKIPESILKDVQKARKNKNYDALENLIKKTHQYLPQFIVTLLLLLHPKNLSFVLDKNLIVLVHSLSNYFVFCSMIIRCLDKNDGDTYITNREMKNSFFNCGLQNQLDIYWISRIWTEILNSIIKPQLKSFSKSDKENKNIEALIFSKISTPSIKVYFYRIFPENTFAYIKEFDVDSDKSDKLGLDRDIIGLGYNTSRNFGFNNDLWRLFSFNHPESNGYLIFNENNETRDVLPAMIEGLYRSARQSAIAINSISTSWDNFIKDPYEVIDEKLSEFDEWIYSFILDSYQIRDEFFKFKPFTRLIGDIDTEMDREIIKEVSDEYRTAKYYHIPNEMRQKLLDAEDELDIFVKLVIKKIKKQEEKIGDQESVLNFFDAHKEKYRYLNLLRRDDIKKIDFSTGANASRNNRRKILPIINQKLGGKNFKESTLTKLLGLEPGKEKYLKYSK